MPIKGLGFKQVCSLSMRWENDGILEDDSYLSATPTTLQLTFGDAPFRVESIKVNDDRSHGLEMEYAVRWCGDANITLAIDLADTG